MEEDFFFICFLTDDFFDIAGLPLNVKDLCSGLVEVKVVEVLLLVLGKVFSLLYVEKVKSLLKQPLWIWVPAFLWSKGLFRLFVRFKPKDLDLKEAVKLGDSLREDMLSGPEEGESMSIILGVRDPIRCFFLLGPWLCDLCQIN